MDIDKKVILAVDDMPVNLMLIKNQLSQRYDVRVAKSGEFALSVLARIKVDLILLDVEMPGMSGFEFIEKARETPGVDDIPVIFVTAHKEGDVLDKIKKTGAKDYIIKPIDPAELEQKTAEQLTIADG